MFQIKKVRCTERKYNALFPETRQTKDKLIVKNEQNYF